MVRTHIKNAAIIDSYKVARIYIRSSLIFILSKSYKNMSEPNLIWILSYVNWIWILKFYKFPIKLYTLIENISVLVHSQFLFFSFLFQKWLQQWNPIILKTAQSKQWGLWPQLWKQPNELAGAQHCLHLCWHGELTMSAKSSKVSDSPVSTTGETLDENLDGFDHRGGISF